VKTALGVLLWRRLAASKIPKLKSDEDSMLIGLIGGAVKQIDIAAYVLTNRAVIEALRKAATARRYGPRLGSPPLRHPVFPSGSPSSVCPSG
jgi:hypothetical protein